MASIKHRLFDLVDVVYTKMNLLNSLKEEYANKKQDLTSTNSNHFPSVPAVKQGLDSAIVICNYYTDEQLNNLPAYIPLSFKGAPNGVAELNGVGQVPAWQLPSYIDEVMELQDFVGTNPTSGMTAGQKWYNNVTKKIFTATGATTGTVRNPTADKVYLRKATNQVYRWSGTTMVQMADSLVLGETEYTAYRGDRGKLAYLHISRTDNPHNVTKAQVGLGNADNTSDYDKPVSYLQNIAITDVQIDLNHYRSDEVGHTFPDYALQLEQGLQW